MQRFFSSELLKGTLALVLAATYGYYFSKSILLSAAMLLIFLPASTSFVLCSVALATVGMLAFPRMVDAGISATVVGPYLALEVVLGAFFAFRGRLHNASLVDAAPDEKAQTWKHRIWTVQWTVASVFIVSLGFRTFPFVTNGALAALLFLVGYGLRPAGGFTFPSPTDLLKNGALFFGSLAVTLGILEVFVGLMLFPDHRGDALYERHPEYLYALRPSSVSQKHYPVNTEAGQFFRYEISSEGIRDREYGPKAEDEFRVVIIGDSFTFGVTVDHEDTLSSALESALADVDLPSQVSVYNLGVSGTGPWQHRGYLSERGFPIEPDLVIHQLFLGNDVCDTLHQSGGHVRAYFREQGSIVAVWQHQDRMRFRVDVFLRDHVKIYRAIRDRVNPRTMYRFLTHEMRFLPRIEDANLPGRLPGMPEVEVNLTEWYPELTDGWDQMLADIESTRDLCRERDVDYVTFAIPTKATVIDGVWKEALVEGLDRTYERGKGVRLLHEALAQRDVPFIDIATNIAAHPDPSVLYFKRDGHLNSEGNREAAALLGDYVVDRYFPAAKPAP